MNGKEFLRKVQFLMMLALGTYPACASIVVFIAPQVLGYIWLLTGIFFLVGSICLLLPAKVRLVVGVLGCLLLLLPPLLLLRENARVIFLIFGACYSALLLWSLQFPGWSEERELGFGWLAACMTFLIVGCGLAYYDHNLASVSLGMRISMFVFVFLAMRSLNRNSLTLAAGGRGSISGKMRRKNALLILGMFALAILVALIPSAIRLLEMLFSLIRITVEKATTQAPVESMVPTTAPPTTEPTSGGGGGGGMDNIVDYLPPSNTPPSTFVIMAIVAWGTMIPLGIFVIIKLGKLLWRTALQLAQKVVDGTNLQAEDFEDEITDTRDEADACSPESANQKEKTVFVRLTPTEKIRHRYKRLLDKNPKWQGSSTARENLNEDAAVIYEKARYSSHAVTEQDAENFKNKTK